MWEILGKEGGVSFGMPPRGGVSEVGLPAGPSLVLLTRVAAVDGWQGARGEGRRVNRECLRAARGCRQLLTGAQPSLVSLMEGL